MDERLAIIDGRQWRITERVLESSEMLDSLAKYFPDWSSTPRVLFDAYVGKTYTTRRAARLALVGDNMAGGVPSKLIDALIDASYEVLPSFPEVGNPNVPLYRSANGGGKLHLPDCSHVRGIDLIEASSDDRSSMDVCTACTAELSGQGRTYHATVEAAMEDMGTPRGSWAELSRLIGDVFDDDRIYVPASRSYLAILRGGKTVAYAGKTYLWRDGTLTILPDYVATSGGGPERDLRRGAACDIHYVERSVTGVCPMCE